MSHAIPFSFVCNRPICMCIACMLYAFFCVFIVVLIVVFFLGKPILCDEVHILTHAFTGREKGIQFIETQTARNNPVESVYYEHRRSRCCNLFNKYALMKAAFHYVSLSLFLSFFSTCVF